MDRSNILSGFIGAMISVVVILGAIYVFPWDDLDWGVFRLGNERTVTVTGTAYQRERNKIARFTANVTVVDEDKGVANEEVNVKMADLIEMLKEFGIDNDDIKTQQISVNEAEPSMMRYPVPEVEEGFRASNSIEVILRDVERAGELATLLTESGANNVYGPSFMVDETGEVSDDLIGEALMDARVKAEEVAKLSGARLGKVLMVSESGGYYPQMLRSFGGAMMEDTASGVPVEPGTSGVSKSVTVTFSLR